MPFRLVALGELSLYASGEGRKLAVPRKGLALMAVLASAGGRPVPREKVATLLWPDSEDSGRGALKQTIYELRQTLGNHNVVVGTAELSLDPAEITSDVGDLESAYAGAENARVLELYTGPFLDRFQVRSSAEFDHWVDAQRARYSGILEDALEKSARAASASGDLHSSAKHWRRLAAEDPLNSRVALGLIEALTIGGDPAGALAHYRVHEQLLRDELGTQPDAALAAVAERIRAGQVKSRLATNANVDERNAIPSRSAPPLNPPPAIAPVRTRPARSAMLALALLLVTAGAIAAMWIQRSPARVLASIPLPPNSSSRVTVDLHLNRIFIDGGASFDNSLTVVNGATMEVRSLPHGAGAAIDPATLWLWTGDYRDRLVVVRNGRTNAEIGRIPVPGCPHHFAIDARRTWIAQQCEDHITAVDNRTRAVVRHIRVPTLSRAEVGGAKGMGEMFVNRSTGVVYFWKDMIPHRLDPRTWEIRETPGIDGPIFAVNEPTNRLYARIDNGLQVIDGATDKVVAHVKLAATPARVAIGFGGRLVYVATPRAVSALDGNTHRVRWSMPFEEGFTAHGLAADDGRGRLYVLGNATDGRPYLKILRLNE